MAVKKVYLGSIGPYLFDDTDDIDDPDGDFAGRQVAPITAEQLQITSAPAANDQVIRFQELISDLRRYSVLASPTLTAFTPSNKRDFRYLFMLGG